MSSTRRVTTLSGKHSVQCDFTALLFPTTLVRQNHTMTHLTRETASPGRLVSYQTQGLFWRVVAAEDTRVPPVKEAASRKRAGLCSSGYAWAQTFPRFFWMISSLCFCLCGALSRDVSFSAVVIKHEWRASEGPVSFQGKIDHLEEAQSFQAGISYILRWGYWK